MIDFEQWWKEQTEKVTGESYVPFTKAVAKIAWQAGRKFERQLKKDKEDD